MSHIGRDEAMKLVDGAAGTNKSPVEVLDLASKINSLEDAKIDGEDRANVRKDIREMRKRWSEWILRAIVAIIFFDFVVVFCVGLGWMRFDSQVILPVFIGESLVQTLGLAVIIVRFLFHNDSRP